MDVDAPEPMVRLLKFVVPPMVVFVPEKTTVLVPALKVPWSFIQAEMEVPEVAVSVSVPLPPLRTPALAILIDKIEVLEGSVGSLSVVAASGITTALVSVGTPPDQLSVIVQSVLKEPSQVKLGVVDWPSVQFFEVKSLELGAT